MLLNVDSVEFQRMRRDLEDSYDEEFEMELDDKVERSGPGEAGRHAELDDARVERRVYFRELFRLQHE